MTLHAARLLGGLERNSISGSQLQTLFGSDPMSYADIGEIFESKILAKRLARNKNSLKAALYSTTAAALMGGNTYIKEAIIASSQLRADVLGDTAFMATVGECKVLAEVAEYWPWLRVTGLHGNIHRVQASGTRLIAFGGTKVATSDDRGATWTLRADSANVPQHRELARTSTSVILCAASCSATSTLTRSTDNGASWAPVSNFSTTEWASIASNGVGYVAAPAGGQSYLYTSDAAGTTWTLRSHGQSFSLKRIRVGKVGGVDNSYVAIGSNGVAIHSTNEGAAWSICTGLDAGETYISLCYGNGVWVACAASSFAVSADGITWIPYYVDHDLRDIIYHNGYFFGFSISSASLKKSLDGVNWVNVPLRYGIPSSPDARSYIDSIGGSLCYIEIGASFVKSF